MFTARDNRSRCSMKTIALSTTGLHASGSSGCIPSPDRRVSPRREQSRWRYFPQGEARRIIPPFPGGACPRRSGFAPILIQAGGASAPPPPACAPGLADAGGTKASRATDVCERSEAFGRGRATEDVRRIAKRPASVSQAARQRRVQHDRHPAPVRTRLTTTEKALRTPTTDPRYNHEYLISK